MRTLAPAALAVAALAFATLGAPLPSYAGTTKVQHTSVAAPTWASEVDAGIGAVTHMQQHGDLLVLAGQDGVAAVGADGQLKWKVELPSVMVRNVAVDDQGIAWTGWTLAGVEDRWKALNAWADGSLVDKFVVEGASVGYVGLDGTAAWKVDSADQHALSPPGLSPTSVGVNTGEHVVAYNRTDGSVLGQDDLGDSRGYAGNLSGVLDHGTRGEMHWIGDGFYTSFFSHFYKTDANGKILDKEYMAGLTPYVDVTCGPEVVGDLIVFGSTGDSNISSALFAMNDKMKNKWKTWSPDKQSGCGDMVVDGDVAYASSNFWVFAIDDRGKVLWQDVNRKGGLYPSQNRGIRYIPGSSFGARKTYGDLMVVGNGKVYVATKNGHDVVTVLDAKTGKYQRTIDVDATIVSMAVVGGKVAIATDSGLKLLADG